MSGCLTLPFKVLGCLGLILLLVAGWFYRDRLLSYVHRMTGPRKNVAASAAIGRPSTSGAERARDKIDSLNAWHADSVVLTANEMASLIGAGLDPAFRGQLDSLQLKLESGRVGVEASLITARIPKDVMGPLGEMVGDREHLSAGGVVELTEPGRAVWIVDRLSLGNFPFPTAMIPRLLERAMGSHASEVPFIVPQGITGVRIRPTGVTLFGDSRP
ncbi:MAG: hypothetical protein ABI679_11325 [Gemmatimonadota bacterium]